MINYGTKIFNDSKSLARNGASCVASSGATAQDNILNFDKNFAWSSVGSNDSTTETLTITLPEATAITRIYLTGINWKNFNIKYNGSNNFSNVTTLDATGGASIAETNWTKSTAYYEFDSVSVTSITITINTTQTANQQKTCNIFCATTEIGTFSNSGLFQVNPTIDFNERQETNITNRVFIEKGIETFSCTLSAPYIALQADLDIIETMKNSQEDFIVWICGGGYGSDFARLEQKPYRLQDIYRMQVVGSSSANFYNNSYFTGIVDSLRLVEVA